MTRFTTPELRLIFVILFVVTMLVALIPAQPAPQYHQQNQPGHWYSTICCSLNDCEPLPPEAVENVRGGWHVRYLAKSGLAVDEFVAIDASKRKDSLDGHFHGCANTIRLICLYVPPDVS